VTNLHFRISLSQARHNRIPDHSIQEISFYSQDIQSLSFLCSESAIEQSGLAESKEKIASHNVPLQNNVFTEFPKTTRINNFTTLLLAFLVSSLYLFQIILGCHRFNTSQLISGINDLFTSVELSLCHFLLSLVQFDLTDLPSVRCVAQPLMNPELPYAPVCSAPLAIRALAMEIRGSLQLLCATF
jgi:hypothetical protein